MDKVENYCKTITFKIHKLVFLIDKVADQTLESNSDLTLSQFLILMAIQNKPKVSQGQIAKFLELTQAAVSRQIEILRKKGLILRKDNFQNRREHILSITEKGKKHSQMASKLIMSKFDDLYKVMKEGEKTAFKQSLDKLLEVICKSKGSLQ